MSHLEELRLVVDALEKARCPEDVFGASTEVAPMYRRLAALLHPDRWLNERSAHRELADASFRKLGEFKAGADFKLGAGTYGDRSAPATPKPPFAPITIELRGQKFVAESVLCDGDVCTIYRGTHDGSACVLKAAKVPAHNDLVENEAKVLRELYPVDAKEEGLLRYLPRLIESFSLRGPKGPRRVNVLADYGELHSLAAVVRAYPAGIDFRDAAWMLRRMLEGLGHVHRLGYVHGAVLPSHVLVRPANHGARLIDWSYAVRVGQTIRAISAPHRANYPAEVINKRPATPATDIYMWAECASELLNGAETHWQPTVPMPIIAFLSGCLLPNPNRRPTDAWALHEEFGELLEKLVGKPTFRPFSMPGAS